MVWYGMVWYVAELREEEAEEALICSVLCFMYVRVVFYLCTSKYVRVKIYLDTCCVLFTA